MRVSCLGIRLQDKTALVTGATSTMGRAVVIAFAAEAHML
jgi:NAD(P)-dependent dehydrogenase (short-subunit alcohol dehydrogenase family)